MPSTCLKNAAQVPLLQKTKGEQDPFRVLADGRRVLTRHCLQCPEDNKRTVVIRGLCNAHYLQSKRRVKKGETTWEKLEKAGLAIGESNFFPIEVGPPHSGRWIRSATFERYGVSLKNVITFESNEHGTCLRVDDASTLTGRPASVIRRYARTKRSRCTENKKFISLQVSSPTANRWEDEYVIPVKILDLVNGAPGEIDAGPGKDSDDYMLSDPELELAFPEQIPNGRNFRESHWRKKSLLEPHRKALRTRSMYRRDSGSGPDKVWHSRQGDVKAVLAGKESKHPRAGQSSRERPGAHSQLEATWLVRFFLRDKPPQAKAEFFKFCSDNTISAAQRRTAIDDLRIEIRHVGEPHKTAYYLLPREPPRLDHAPALRKAAEFLETALANGAEVPLQVLVEKALKNDIRESKLYLAFPEVGAFPKGPRGSTVYRLVRPKEGSESLTSGDTPVNSNGSTVHTDALNGTPAQKRRGRKPATKRHRKWEAEHKAGKSLGQIAIENGVRRRTVVKALHNLARELNSPAE